MPTLREPIESPSPAKPTIGLRTTRANEIWHIDTTVIRLPDGTRASLHAVIDSFSRRILAWRVADTFAPIKHRDRAARRQIPTRPSMHG